MSRMLRKQKGSMSPKHKRQEVPLILRLSYLLRWFVSAASSRLGLAKSEKAAALRRRFFGRLLTPCDDREHKSAENNVCLRSHTCRCSRTICAWRRHILQVSLQAEVATVSTSSWLADLNVMKLRSNFLSGNKPGLLFNNGAPSMPAFPFSGCRFAGAAGAAPQNLSRLFECRWSPRNKSTK